MASEPDGGPSAPGGWGAEPGSALRRCVGDAEAFARDHWARAPLYRPQADPGAFADLFSLEAVDHLIASTALRTPAFRLVKEGETLAPERYTKTGRIGSRPVSDLADPGKVFAEFGAGATIVLQSVHRYWPALAHFCRELELALTHPVQVNIYVTPPASRGLAVHHDGHDVFVLQVHGRKQWDVYDSGDDDGSGPKRVEGELAPGDVLYIPKTFPHAARTGATASVHLTIGVLRTTWRDLLARAVDQVLDDRSLDDPLPIGYADDPTLAVAGLTERLSDLAGRVEKSDPQALVEGAAERFFASRPPLLAGHLSQVLHVGDLRDDSVVTRRAGSVFRLRRSGDRVVVTLGDRELRMPAHLESALREIAGRSSLAPSDLAAHLDADDRLVLVRRLVREGLLVTEV